MFEYSRLVKPEIHLRFPDLKADEPAWLQPFIKSSAYLFASECLSRQVSLSH